MLFARYLLTFLGLFSSSFAMAAEPLTNVRIGWQIPWATQGQLVQIWKHTEILKKNGLKAEFIGRTFGPLLNELALAGSLDVVLTGDQPGITLISKGKGWQGIGRLMYNRTVTFVPPTSSVKDLLGLKGKTIGLPFGAAAERVTIEALRAAGVDPMKEVKIVNLDIREQPPLILKSEGKDTFDQFDALAAFDPMPAIFEVKNKIRVLHSGKVVSLILMNDAFLKKEPLVGARVMQALLDAYEFYRTNAKQANEWFMTEAMLNGATQEACNLAASVEPNLKALKHEELRVSFSAEDFASLQSAADFLKERIGTRVDIMKTVSNAFADKAK